MCIPSGPKPQTPAAPPSQVPSLQAATDPILGDPSLGRGASLLGRLALRLGGGMSSSSTTGGGGTQGNAAAVSSPGTGGAPAPSSPTAFMGGPLGLSSLRLGQGNLV